MSHKKNEQYWASKKELIKKIMSVLCFVFPIILFFRTFDWHGTLPFFILFWGIGCLMLPNQTKEKLVFLLFFNRIVDSKKRELEEVIQDEKKELLNAYDTEIYRLALQRKDLEIELLALKDDRRALIHGIETYKVNFNDQVYQYKIQKEALDDVVKKLALQKEYQSDVAKNIFSSTNYEAFVSFLVTEDVEKLKVAEEPYAISYLRGMLLEEYDYVLINRNKKNKFIHLIAEKTNQKHGFYFTPEPDRLSKELIKQLERSKKYFNLNKVIIICPNYLSREIQKEVDNFDITVWQAATIKNKMKTYQQTLITEDKKAILKSNQ